MIKIEYAIRVDDKQQPLPWTVRLEGKGLTSDTTVLGCCDGMHGASPADVITCTLCMLMRLLMAVLISGLKAAWMEMCAMAGCLALRATQSKPCRRTVIARVGAGSACWWDGSFVIDVGRWWYQTSERKQYECSRQ